MPTPFLLPLIFREVFGKSQFPREPEPDLVMTDQGQVTAYETAGRTDGVMKAAYLFHAARISMVIKGAGQIIDLACGPATQFCLVAKLNPEIAFTGIDFSDTMLTRAKAHAAQLGLENVRFRKGDIANLAQIADRSCDGIISTMALHHLPTVDHLRNCFEEIKRMNKPGGRLYLVDFGRLKYLKSVLFFAYMNRKHQPHIFSLDYERSLRAAFLEKELQQLSSQYLPDYELISTFPVPFLVIIKSKDHTLDTQTLDRLKKERMDLPKPYRKILDDMRLFLNLSGMKNDPFK